MAKEIETAIVEEREWISPGNTERFYANATRVAVSGWDIRIDFGRQAEISESGIALQEEASVNMSPQHAKALLKNLASSIAKYEQIFGDIPDVAEIAKREREEKRKSGTRRKTS